MSISYQQTRHDWEFPGYPDIDARVGSAFPVRNPRTTTPGIGPGSWDSSALALQQDYHVMAIMARRNDALRRRDRSNLLTTADLRIR